MNTSQDKTIPCPVCKTPIPFYLDLLLKGEAFVCPQCNAKISLSTQSSTIVQEALDKLHQLEQEKQ